MLSASGPIMTHSAVESSMSDCALNLAARDDGLSSRTNSRSSSKPASASKTPRPPRANSPAAATPEAVAKSFNSWAFKREQPAGLDKMLEFIDEAMKLNQPIPFVLYWGKGPRAQAAEPEAQCLRYLASLGDRIKAVYPAGAAIKLIFTDTHARLNGHGAESMRRYFASVEEMARPLEFDVCLLGDLIKAADGDPRLARGDDALDFGTLQKLRTCATKWYGGGGTAQEGAMRYYEANMTEKRAVEIAFPRSIFVTFNGSEFPDLFPRGLPTFYMYSIRRGVSVKPWFLDAPADPRAADAPVVMAALRA